MSTSYTRSSLAIRGLSVLRSVGGWVAISPEQTYVATSIRGLGPCKSTYCRAERRELPDPSGTREGAKWVPLVAAALAAVGLLASCASYRPMTDRQGVANPDQYERSLADCQKYAGPVSPAGTVRTGAAGGVFSVAPAAAERDVGKGGVAAGLAVSDKQARAALGSNVSASTWR